MSNVFLIFFGLIGVFLIGFEFGKAEMAKQLKDVLSQMSKGLENAKLKNVDKEA